MSGDRAMNGSLEVAQQRVIAVLNRLAAILERIDAAIDREFEAPQDIKPPSGQDGAP